MERERTAIAATASLARLSFMLIIAIASLLVASRQARAQDAQAMVESGDAQTCIDGNLGCAGIDGISQANGTNGIIALNASLMTEYGAYTTNENVLLVPDRDWWKPAWLYRTPILFTEQSGNNIANVRVQTVVNTLALIAAGKMRSDCADIRMVTKSGQLTEYTVQSCNTTSTIINLTLLSLGGSQSITYTMYYGKPSATDASAPVANDAPSVSPTATQGAEERWNSTNIMNAGTADAIGRVLMTVEKNITGVYTTIAVIVNDTAYNRSVPAGGALPLSDIWNLDGWNTTLAGAGQYRARMQFINNNTVIADAVAPFNILDNIVGITLAPLSSVQSNTSVDVAFLLVAYRNVSNCQASFTNAPESIDIIPDEAGLGATTLNGLPASTMNVSVVCQDVEGHTAMRAKQITIIASTSFGGATTDLATVNISNITNLTLEVPAAGQIRFTQNVDLSGGADLNRYITIVPRNITIDTVALAALNRSATLTFFGVNDIAHPVIFVDGVVCQSCAISSFGGGTLVVTVPHFSSYVISPNSRLDAWDTTDTELRGSGTPVEFFGNYTNVTSGAPIIGATCTVTFNDTGAQAMSYDAGLQAYTYNRTFTNVGVDFFTISCSATGYDTLNTTDYASISAAVGPVSPTNITVAQTSHGAINTSPVSTDAQGGNTSEVDLTTVQITGTWQGVYGNLSGQVTLATADQSTFYNWSLKNFSGEVYAARASDVNFATIGCSQDSQITQEDTFLGSGGASDAVNNTFTQHNHPAFATGNVNISGNSCRSTNLFTPTGPNPTQYYQILLIDGANNTVYTSLFQHGGTGFDGELTDFQMLVPVRQDVVEPYYYYVEIN